MHASRVPPAAVLGAVALVALAAAACAPPGLSPRPRAVQVGARPGAGPGRPVCYRPPVVAPVVDHFRPPTSPYGPGNRGTTYATTPGQPVRVAAPGTVRFAGLIGHRRYASVAHTDGLRTTYSWLATLSVRSGQVLAAGSRVGTAGDRFHAGVLDHGTYLDPERVWGRGCPGRVVLVPLVDTGSHP